jgi:N-acetylmuramoyl-L-alanine amidase
MPWSRRCSILAAYATFAVCALSILRPAVQQPPALSTSSPTPLPAVSPAPDALAKAQPEFFVLIDPSHGGDDKGAVFSSRIAEKDVTLALARELRKELEERGIAARLLRDSDANVSLEHRAEISNQQHPELYIALHAGTPGSGVRVYAPLVFQTQQTPGRFLPWETAQASSLERSEAIAKAVRQELQKKDIKAPYFQAFLRPLNNVIAPAIAVEMAVDRGDLRPLGNEKLEGSVASAVASAIAQSLVRVGGRK